MVNWRVGGGVSQLLKKEGGFMKYQIKNNLSASFLFSLSVSAITGRARLIRSHSSARFSFELSGNSN